MIEFEEAVWNAVGQFHVKKEDHCKVTFRKQLICP
ncbi:NADH dehydrogenase [ubiquinone] flavoprotein 1 [Psidium guajava]|nr:NADH dehydrogenase [ubiquinone] flavoprotein 1 [Psidium guajava]